MSTASGLQIGLQQLDKVAVSHLRTLRNVHQGVSWADLSVVLCGGVSCVSHELSRRVEALWALGPIVH